MYSLCSFIVKASTKLSSPFEILALGGPGPVECILSLVRPFSCLCFPAGLYRGWALTKVAFRHFFYVARQYLSAPPSWPPMVQTIPLSLTGGCVQTLFPAYFFRRGSCNAFGRNCSPLKCEVIPTPYSGFLKSPHCPAFFIMFPRGFSNEYMYGRGAIFNAHARSKFFDFPDYTQGHPVNALPRPELAHVLRKPPCR